MKVKYIVQIGMGVDQHGHNMDATNAAIKAVKNAISNNCLAGLREILNMEDPMDMIVEVLIARPKDTDINEKKVLRALPFGKKSITITDGGMITSGVCIKELGDLDDQMIVVNAAVTVFFELNKKI